MEWHSSHIAGWSRISTEVGGSVASTYISLSPVLLEMKSKYYGDALY
jgi:hypothetical protein